MINGLRHILIGGQIINLEWSYCVIDVAQVIEPPKECNEISEFISIRFSITFERHKTVRNCRT